MPVLALQFYNVVVAVHVMCVVIAFGVTFAYPVMLTWLKQAHPQTMPAIHEAQARLGGRLITPFATLVLLTGIYLATDGKWWSEVWVTVPFLILIVLLGLGGAFFTPRERRIAAIARRDLDAGGELSDEYEAQLKTLAMVGTLDSALVLIAVFFMVAKPFA